MNACDISDFGGWGLSSMANHKLITALAFAGFVCSSSAVLSADPMGAVVAVEGRPTASGTGGTRALSAGSDVFEGDTITVGAGNAQMELDDGTKLVVGPSSRLVLQSYLRRNQSTAKTVGLKALRGTFRVITGNSPKSAYKITTNNATIGVRGTGFDFNVSNKTVLAVLEGAVRMRGANGQAVNTEAGCGVAEAGKGGVTAQELDGDPKSAALLELPYVIDQSPLNTAFYLPTDNCLPFLPANPGGGATPTPPPGLLLVPVIPGAILYRQLTKDKDDPISPEVRQIDCSILPIDPSC
jgi:hypothetical protein